MTRIAGTVAETVPVGHGAVATYPDRPYLRWEYRREKDGERISRNNPEDFLEGCERLYDFFVEFVRDNAKHGNPDARDFSEIRETVRSILEQEGLGKNGLRNGKTLLRKMDYFRQPKVIRM